MSDQQPATYHPQPGQAPYSGQAPAAFGGAMPTAQPAPAIPARRPERRILGIQPVLFVGIVLLVLVALLTIALIFVGDIETQALRVVWTVVAFIGFTGLLALDLALSRRSSVPLVIGVAANVYLLAILMLATWVEMRPVDLDGDSYSWEPPIGVTLIGVYLLAFVTVRAAAAAAWALIALGRRGGAAVSRATGLVAAALVGLAAVLLTAHLAITPFGVEVGDLYWRLTVAVVVLAALAACVTTLLFWNRRHLDGPPPARSHPDARVAPPRCRVRRDGRNSLLSSRSTASSGMMRRSSGPSSSSRCRRSLRHRRCSRLLRDGGSSLRPRGVRRNSPSTSRVEVSTRGTGGGDASCRRLVVCVASPHGASQALFREGTGCAGK